MSSDCKEISLVVLFVLFCCAFLASIGYVVDGTRHKNDPLIENGGTPCGIFPKNVSKIHLKKQITSQWHWDYDIEIGEHKGQVLMRCPTVMHDLNVIFDNTPIGRTDGKTFSLISEVDTLDCHNNKVYTIRTGSVFETIINSNKIFVSLDVRYNDTIIYYVDKQIFITENIDLFDVNNVKVANLHRFKLGDLIHLQGWTWDIVIFDPINHPVDPMLLVTIAGQHSFSETDSNGNAQYDTCNSVYHGVYIFMFVIMGLVIIGICIIVCIAVSEKCDS